MKISKDKCSSRIPAGSFASGFANIFLVLQLFATALLTGFFMPLSGAELPQAEGKVILNISGNISNSNSKSGIEIDMTMIEALPAVSFSTETPWTEGMVEWTGVRLSDFLAYIGAGSKDFHTTALDGYEVNFKNVDIEKYPVIIAYKQNGEYMSVRNLGPLWIMFPFSDYPEIDIQMNRTLSVWQLLKMKVI